MLKILLPLLLVAQLGTAQVAIQDCSIGQSTIQIKTEHFQPVYPGIYFINLHANETTSIEATTAYLATVGGSFLQLVHGQVRYVDFTLNNMAYRIDPNRIFTQQGRKETLKKNSSYNLLAEKETARFADTILAQLKDAKLIVAMHNNTDGDLSITSYTKGKAEAMNAADVYINKEMDADDFVYTTERSIFEHLKKQQINVVLQKAKGFKDDGSLSVYCGTKHIAYINIEAQQGHKEQQLQMLQALTSILEQYKK